MFEANTEVVFADVRRVVHMELIVGCRVEGRDPLRLDDRATASSGQIGVNPLNVVVIELVKMLRKSWCRQESEGERD